MPNRKQSVKRPFLQLFDSGQDAFIGSEPKPKLRGNRGGGGGEGVEAGLRFRLPIPHLKVFLDFAHVREPFDRRLFVAYGVDQANLKRLAACVDAASLDLLQRRGDALAPLLDQANEPALRIP